MPTLLELMSMHIYGWTFEHADLRSVSNVVDMIDRAMPEAKAAVQLFRQEGTDRTMIYESVAGVRRYVNYLEWAVRCLETHGHTHAALTPRLLIRETEEWL